MKVTISPLDSVTGWTASAGTVTIPGTNEDSRYIADSRAASTILRFNKALNQYASLPISPTVNVGQLRDITLAIWSRNKASVDYRMPSDFSYKIDFGTGVDYYLPVFPIFDSVTIRIPENAVVSRIRITALHNDDDYLIVSNCLAVKDNFPLDLLQGAKDNLQALLIAAFPVPGRPDLAGIKVGTCGSAPVGQAFIVCPTQPDYLDRYAKFCMTNGVISEVHAIDRETLGETTGTGPVKFYLDDKFDGKTITQTFTGFGADLYLIFDVDFARKAQNVILPSITIWGFSSGFDFEATELWDILETWNASDDTVERRRSGQLVEWSLLIDCEARSYELIEYMAKHVREFIVNNPFWVNGKGIDAGSDGISNEIEPNDAYGIIPKVQYPIKLSVREDLWARMTLAKALAPTITANPLPPTV